MAKCMCCGEESRFMCGHTCDFFHVNPLDLAEVEDGVIWICPDCERAFEDYARECGRKWLLNTKVQKAARRGAYQKAYREANREELIAYKRAYYEANREKAAAYGKDYYKAHREERLAYQRARREANREKALAYQRAYREKKKKQKEGNNA